MRAFFVILLAGHLCYSSIAGTVRGKVVGEGEGLPGVSVSLLGTTRGTITGPSGEFSIRDISPGGYEVIFSLIGYQRESRRVTVDDQDTEIILEVSLAASPVWIDPIVVTASKREQSFQDVPVSVSIVDGSDIAARNVVTLDEALRYVPGVNLTEFQVNVRGSSGYSRGAGSRVLMLVDGIPFLTGDTGEMNFETIPAGQVDRIEVVKGASSALYGSSALGGVINVLTKRIPNGSSTTIRTYGGLYESPSFTRWEWGGGTRLLDGQSLTHSFRTDRTGILAHVSRIADDGFRQNDFRRRYNGYVKTDIDLSAHDALTFTGNLLHQRRGSFLYWKDLQHALVPPDQQQGDRVQSTRFFLSGQYRHVSSPVLSFAGRSIWFRNNWNDTIDTLTNESTSDVVRTEVQATWLPAPDHVLTVGVEGSATNINADLFGSRSGNGIALYVQDEIELGEGLKVTLGARFDHQDLDSLESRSQFNPKLGVVFVPAAGTTFRGSMGRGFRTPSAAEAFVTAQAGGVDIIPNLALQAERSTSYEIGVSQLLGGFAFLDIALFQSEFKNLIEPRFVEIGGVLKAQFDNVTRARVRGFETSVAAGIIDRLATVRIGHTYIDPIDLTLDEILKYRPRHLLYSTFSFHPSPYSFEVDVRHISRVERIDKEFSVFVADAEERVSISVVDMRVSGEFPLAGASLSLTMNVKNIFQYNYVELVGNLSPPRTYLLSLQATW